MRDFKQEYEKRVAYIQNRLRDAGASGVVYGNSGGKDSALVGILCKAACENTVGLLMPCASGRNYGQDLEDGQSLAKQFGIETRFVDLTGIRELEIAALRDVCALNELAVANIAPRLRMTTLYAVAASENRLVAGTGNRSEAYMGYFTKWGDGACDFNPIADLTVTEIYAFLRFLDAPPAIMEKAPSAGLYDGQTDEGEMGFTYEELDSYLLTGEANPEIKKRIEALRAKSEHKRHPVPVCRVPA